MLVWLDLETTGLDPQRDHVLEMAVAFATLENPFEVTARCEWVFPYTARGYVDPVVFAMHARNGLWAECDKAVVPAGEAERWMLERVPEVESWEDQPTLAGNCVGFDHAFLKARMPALAARFHYRHYDVSSVKLFCRSLGMPRLPKQEVHRAARDVEASIADAKACRAWLEASIADAKVCRDWLVERRKGP